MTELRFNLVETVAFATAILWLGMFLRKRISFLSKYNIPAPVIGGVIFALASWALKDSFSFNFDMLVKDPLMITFFTSIGLAASFKMLKQGGPQVFIFLMIASVLVILQDVLAVALSYATGIHPLLGMLAGSITMSGGHGTGAVYANLFEKQYGLAGGMELAMAAATFGLVMGSILGGPVARRIIERNHLAKSHLNPDEMTYETVDESLDAASDGPVSASVLMTTLMQITIAMSAGAFIYEELVKIGIQLPTYLCALFVGIFIRNLSDVSGLYKVHLRLADTIGAVALSLFLALSLMSLKLWQLADLAGPLVVLLAGQTVFILLYVVLVVFNVMGRDYDAAVLVSGTCGFGMGATPNAMANMQAVCEKYVPSVKAYLLIPLVGSLFADFLNSLVITVFINFI